MTLIYDAFSAYLGPLLSKHDAGKTVTWTDLQQSYKAAKTILEPHNNIFVTKRFEALHESQVAAYNNAATKAIDEWMQSIRLEPMEDNDSEENYVNRCVKALSPKAPKWEGKDLNSIEKAIREKAKEMYAKYNPPAEQAAATPSAPAPEDNPAAPMEDDDDDGEDGEMEDNDANEDGETNETPNESGEDDEDGEIGDDAAESGSDNNAVAATAASFGAAAGTAPNTAPKKVPTRPVRKVAAKRQTATSKTTGTKTVVRKKTTTVKGRNATRGGKASIATTRPKRGRAPAKK